MQRHHLSDEELAAYLEGVVQADERARIERHLIDCAACLDEVLSLLKIVRPDNRSALPPR